MQGTMAQSVEARSRPAISIWDAFCGAPDMSCSIYAVKAVGRCSCSRPTRRDDVMAYYGELGSVRPLAFAATIKDMKALLHNA
jgi:hypothetical protein